MAEKCGLNGRKASDGSTREMTPDKYEKTKEIFSMTVDELSSMFVGIDRQITPKEAQTLYDMIHKTERAHKKFEMNDIELKRAEVFADTHKSCISRSATSEKFEYTFIPGGIGIYVSIKCLICGSENNLTDYDRW